jgi:vacuolar protein sorting-associated protein 26
MRVRYFINVLVNRSFNKINKEEDFVVQNVGLEPVLNPPLKFGVGVADYLNLELLLEGSKFHLKDCIVGSVTFHLVRLKIKLMEILLLRREQVGTG